MKNYSYLICLTLMFAQSCKGQEAEQLKFAHWDLIDTKNISVTAIKNPGKGKKMYVPYYEFEPQKIKIGDACLFGISKAYPETWIQKAVSSGCTENRNAYGAIICLSHKLFEGDTTFLKKELDLYLVLINMVDLAPPITEQAEGGTVLSYYPKNESTVIVYKYREGYWEEVKRILQKEGKTPKAFGMDFISRLAREKMDSK